LALLLIAMALVCGGGAQCIPRRGPTAPRLLPEGPSLAQVMDVVNANTARVATYATNNARISVPGLPSLPTDIALERPRRFRLRASTALTGPEVDLGSNDELFWFWVRRNDPPALYVCRHDEYLHSDARRMIPVNPEWLIEALGLTRFDPAYQHSGPYPNRGRENLLEVHTTVPTPEGHNIKVTVVDAIHGYVVEQHIYDGRGERLASSIASEHRYDPATQVALPTRVELQIPRAQLFLTLETGDYRINAPLSDNAQLFAKPTYSGYPEVNLCRQPATQPVRPTAQRLTRPIVIER
jgi:hypothetical protein